ncbi:GNAT family N-acetyltransferase [Fodinicola feengrottensis]|uniref:GNAT family protein n=1 Tax=Fodinicola feengrottensis TaxID=435914 RepID=A0ABP4USW3_9ACTN|nr:GNAT family protein [Fodinicola feengrottensis]
MTTTEQLTAADWVSAPTLTGQHVRLEALSPAHADGLLAAADHDEVFQWLSVPRPTSRHEMTEQITDILAQWDRGTRVPYVQVDLRDGAEVVAGMTSFYEINATTRTVAIGYTWLGRRFWRTPLNTESKLLMLTRAFDELGAVRVVWHTDEFNARSRAAIARLGAQPEGLLRKHKLRKDGTWRTTAQFAMTDDDWPEVRRRLTDRGEK